jgi:regulator of RNase E activity RraA
MKKRTRWIAAAALAAAMVVLMGQAKKATTSTDPLIEGFKKSTVASVSDAVDQVVGARGFMTHEMRPRIPGKIVGRAKTSLVKAAPADKATPALSTKHSVEMIEEANPGDIAVIVMENGKDVASIGGLMATAAQSRGLAGLISDGGLRDIEEIRALGFPVYSTAVTPASAVGRWASVAKNVEVQCGGVKVRPGDIIVAGEDGVVVVPQEKAADVLKRSQEIDDRESKMVPFIKQYRSLSKAIAIFNRI